MAGLKNADNFAGGEKFHPGLLKWVLLMGGGGAALLFFLIAALSGEQFRGAMAYSWLFAVVYFLTLAVGGIFWTLLHNATNSGWGVVVRRLMENLGSVVLVMFALALPLLAPDFRDALWEWYPKRVALLQEAAVHAEHELPARRAALQAAAEEAEAAFAGVEAEVVAAMEGATENEKRYLEARREAALGSVEAAKARQGSDEELKEELAIEHFKHGDYLLYKKSGYLNEGFWHFRFFFYGAGLFLIIWFLRGWSIKLDHTGDPKVFRRMRRAACGFLPLFAIAWTFLVFDWLMALDYTWFSTMWGVYLFAGAALNSMAFLIILLTLLRRAGYLREVVTAEHYHLMGKLLLAFTVFWAYIAFSQYFLIWYANITEETKFYLTRNTEFWNPYTIALLVVGHFFIPFVVLLMQGLKKNPMVISGVAAWTLLMHLFDVYWIIIPERGPSLTAELEEMKYIIPGAIWTDLLAWVAVAGIFGFAVMHYLGRASLFPCRDPRLDESLNVVN